MPNMGLSQSRATTLESPMLTARDGQPGENPLQGHTHVFLEKLMSDSEEYIHLAEKEAMAPV